MAQFAQTQEVSIYIKQRATEGSQALLALVPIEVKCLLPFGIHTPHHLAGLQLHQAVIDREAVILDIGTAAVDVDDDIERQFSPFSDGYIEDTQPQSSLGHQ